MSVPDDESIKLDICAFIGTLLTCLTMPHLCACPKPGSGFQ